MNKYNHVSYEQRIRIEVLLKQSVNKNKIAEEVGIHRSVLYRELNRNKQKRGGYNAGWAQQLAELQINSLNAHGFDILNVIFIICHN